MTSEQYGRSSFSLEDYEERNKDGIKIEAEPRYLRRAYTATDSKTVFCVPCNHPAAEDGVFHCVPSFYNAAHMRDEYEFILVDTKKLIAQLAKDNPQMLDHAARKMSGSTAEDWLASTSMEHPRDMGNWTYSKKRGLDLSSGDAALIKVAQDLDLPYFPISVHKATNHSDLEELKAKVGYLGSSISRQPSMDPAFA